MISAISTALTGMQGASRQFEQSAARLASGPAGGTDDTLNAVVQTMAAQNSFALNTAVLRTALDMQKQVIDILV